MSEQECIHEIPYDWCAVCNKTLAKFEKSLEEPAPTFAGLLKGTTNDTGTRTSKA